MKYSVSLSAIDPELWYKMKTFTFSSPFRKLRYRAANSASPVCRVILPPDLLHLRVSHDVVILFRSFLV